MKILHIEHPVRDFDSWKKTFDHDPAAREARGVRRYRVMRGVDDPNLVMIDLEFDNLGEAETMRTFLQQLWDGVALPAGLISDPRARILEAVESKEIAAGAERI
jgi:hypothetical protein